MEDADDLFKEASWHAVLLGQGMAPARYPALTALTSRDDALALAERLKSEVAARVAAFPAHDAFLASCLGSAPSARTSEA